MTYIELTIGCQTCLQDNPEGCDAVCERGECRIIPASVEGVT